MSSQTFPTYQPHPAMTAPITPAQRDSARRWLQDAYADGRMGQPEFEFRMQRVMAASDRAEMDLAFLGLGQQSHLLDLDDGRISRYAVSPLTSGAGVPATARPGQGSGLALAAHLSFFVAWLLGPAFVRLLAGRGTYAAREAAKAFNWQLTSLVGMIGCGIVASFLPDRMADSLSALFALVWFVLTVVGAVKASHGADWTNPVMRKFGIHAMREGA